MIRSLELKISNFEGDRSGYGLVLKDVKNVNHLKMKKKGFSISYKQLIFQIFELGMRGREGGFFLFKNVKKKNLWSGKVGRNLVTISDVRVYKVRSLPFILVERGSLSGPRQLPFWLYG